jgi:hypothetical protein
MKNSNDTIGNRIRDLQTCNAVPTANWIKYAKNITNQQKCMFKDSVIIPLKPRKIKKKGLFDIDNMEFIREESS